MRTHLIGVADEQTLSTETLIGSDITGAGKVPLIKKGFEHAAKAVFSASTGNLTMKSLYDYETEYRTYPVVVGLNEFGVLFNKIDKATTTINLTTTVFLL